MKKFKLEINGNIQILDGEVFYKSNLQDVAENYLLIDIPVNNGIYLTMHENDEIEAEYYVDGGNYYKFNCRVLGRTREGKLNLYRLSKPYNIIKIQRRNFVRVDMVEYAFYKLQNDNEEEAWKKGIILDLSGGGMKIKTEEKLSLRDRVTVNIFIGENEKIQVVGEAVRVEKCKINEYICGLKFKEISERTRDKIIQKVFEQMRKQRGLV
ncbi:MAG: PilZ domain-containing protein [Clostridium sp.]|uniref:flagellar brake protein n=1 Tax=Clostridium sp. TaxID=1506 RepID=UPI00290C4826|nr:PilZ domain-containing protein [Clostridium sp.]MDU4937076.1 PilZ domain-containing protein [Clostridium sp.]